MIIEFDKSFSKSLDKLKDLVTKKRIERIIQDFDGADTIINIKNVKKLVGFKSYYRIRIGDYRLGIELKTPNIARFIVIAHRKDIYKIFP
jgi:mRNA interferase RelE/StbE